MKSLLFAISVLAVAKPNQGFYYAKPPDAFSVANSAAAKFGTKIIKGSNGKNYELTMAASRKMFEGHVSPNEQVFIVQHFNQPAIGTTSHQTQQLPHAYAPTVFNSLKSTKLQQSFNYQQKNFPFNSNRHNGIFAANRAQNHYNQFAAPARYQPFQQQVTRRQQQPVEKTILVRVLHQAGAFPQSATQRQPLRNNNLVNTPKYVSQSQASQLDVYPYKQVNGNARPFTRIISNCDASGHCEPQNAVATFHQQQVLEQTKIQTEPTAKKCQNTVQDQLTGCIIVKNTTTAPEKKPELKNRRMFPYSETIIPQDPYN